MYIGTRNLPGLLTASVVQHVVISHPFPNRAAPVTPDDFLAPCPSPNSLVDVKRDRVHRQK